MTVHWGKNSFQTTSVSVWSAECDEMDCESGRVSCPHVIWFLRERRELEDGPIPELSRVLVPVFRKDVVDPEASFVVQVGTGHSDAFGNKPFALTNPEGVEKDVIDILSPSSGVWAMRNSILQWAYSMYHTVPPCNSDHHRRTWPFSKTGDRLNDAKQPPIITDIICIIETGVCYRCASDTTSLVPDI